MSSDSMRDVVLYLHMYSGSWSYEAMTRAATIHFRSLAIDGYAVKDEDGMCWITEAGRSEFLALGWLSETVAEHEPEPVQAKPKSSPKPKPKPEPKAPDVVRAETVAGLDPETVSIVLDWIRAQAPKPGRTVPAGSNDPSVVLVTSR